MLRSMELQKFNTARKARDEVWVRCCHYNRSLRDAHECLNSSPETTVITQNNIHLPTTANQLAIDHTRTHKLSFDYLLTGRVILCFWNN